MDAANSMTSQQDIDGLIAGVAMGDRKAFRTLYGKVSPKLYGIALKLCRDDGMAQEALQSAFAQVWMRAEVFRSSGLAPMTWLVGLLRDACALRLREARRDGTAVYRVEIAERLYDAAPSREAQANMREEARALYRCLEELPEERAEMLRKAYLQGYTYAEMSEEAGMPQPALRAAFRRSLLELRACLSA